MTKNEQKIQKLANEMDEAGERLKQEGRNQASTYLVRQIERIIANIFIGKYGLDQTAIKQTIWQIAGEIENLS